VSMGAAGGGVALPLSLGLWVLGGVVAVGGGAVAWGDLVAMLGLGQPSGEGGQCWVCEPGGVGGLGHPSGEGGRGWVCRLGWVGRTGVWASGGGWGWGVGE
jgi:hypothetical protein